MQNRNIVITRGNLGQFGSIIAGLGFLIGVLTFIWQGNFTALVIGAFVVGIVGTLLWVYMTPKDFRDFITGRQVRQGLVAFFSVLLLISIISLIYLLVQREVILIDMTSDSRFTLSQKTYDVLRASERAANAIQITAFYEPQDLVQREIDDQYFQLYETASGGRIQRLYVDPLEEPGIAEPFRPFLERDINVFISFVDDNNNIIFPTTIPVENSGTQERDMTEAIARLLTIGQFNVYFETSTGTIDALDTSPQGLSTFNSFLRDNGIVTNPIDLEVLAQTGGNIPEDASALILARPTRQFTPDEINVLDAYLQDGGALLILQDIFFSEDIFLAEGSPFSNYLWDNFGLRPLNAVVVDGGSYGQSELDVVSYAVFAENDIGANLNIEGQPNTQTQFRMARPTEINPDPPVHNGRVIDTSPFSWAETNFAALARQNEYVFDEGQDVQGPLNTVAWAFDPDTDAKIVLIGDSDFATNAQIESPAGNATLLLDSTGWMTGFNEEVRFKIQQITTGLPILFVGGPMLDIIAFITIILIPGIMLVAAISIQLRRIRR